MKNPSKTSRRSFLKQSSLGILGIANASLFTGLLQRASADPINPDDCISDVFWEWDESGTGFPTSEEAEAAADAAVKNEQLGQGHIEHKTKNAYNPCPDFNPPRKFDTRITEITDGPDGKWSWSVQGIKGTSFC